MCFKIIYLFIANSLILALMVNGQGPNDLDVNDLAKNISEIPGFENFNSSQMPSAADVEKVLREKCKENSGGDEAFDVLQTHQSALKECFENHLNTTQIQIEVEEAKKTGSMDEVFGKYCKKYPEIYECMEKAADSVKACLNDQEKEALDKAINITNELKDFICHKDGDRIAMFVAEGGVTCLQSRQEELEVCVNQSLGARIPKELTVSSLPTFLFTEKDCKDFQRLRSCVNVELEKCEDSTPANIVDAFFKFLKKNSPCSEANIEPTFLAKESSANRSSISFTFIALITLFICKITF